MDWVALFEALAVWVLRCVVGVLATDSAVHCGEFVAGLGECFGIFRVFEETASDDFEGFGGFEGCVDGFDTSEYAFEAIQRLVSDFAAGFLFGFGEGHDECDVGVSTDGFAEGLDEGVKRPFGHIRRF